MFSPRPLQSVSYSFHHHFYLLHFLTLPWFPSNVAPPGQVSTNWESSKHVSGFVLPLNMRCLLLFHPLSRLLFSRQISRGCWMYSETCIRRNRMGPKIFSTLDKFPHYTK
jgi:hypothetical protein